VGERAGVSIDVYGDALVNHLAQPVGFVFSGGASLAAAQVGMLQALLEHEIHPDLVVGTSAGALNAAYVARHPSARCAAELADVWRRLERSAIFPFSFWQQVGRILGRRRSLLTNRALRRFLDQLFGADSRLETAEIPLGVLAARIPSGLPTVFTQGSLPQALLASTAIPGVFPPIDIDDVEYVDGSIVSNVPLVPAKLLGARSFVVLDAGPPCAADAAAGSLLTQLANVIAISTRQRIAASLPAIAAEHRVVYIAAPCSHNVSPFDFQHSARLIDGGYQAAQSLLSQGWPQGPGYVGEPHYHDDLRLNQTWGIEDSLRNGRIDTEIEGA